MYYIRVRDGKKQKWKKKTKINLSILIIFPTIYLATLKAYTKFQTLALTEAEKSVTEIFIGEKEKWTNNRTDKQEAILSYTIQVIPNICTKFKNPSFSSSQ